MRILIVTDRLPYPPTSGSHLRVWNLLRRIGAVHEVTLASLAHADDDPEALSRVGEHCKAVLMGRLVRGSPLGHAGGLARAIRSGRPPELMFQDSPELRQVIWQAACAERFDVVQIERSVMAPYVEALPPSAHCRRVLSFHDVAWHQYARFWRMQPGPVAKARAWAHSRAMRYWEPRYAGRFDRCVTVSSGDRQLLLADNPGLRIDIIPNGVDTRLYRPLPGAGSSLALILVGTMSYAPNADGAAWFCRQVLPRLRQMVAGVQVWIVGAAPTPAVLELARDGVHVTGQVEDVVPYYRRSAVAIVPLRAGGGTRLKILESMALGRPVVSTRIGCEGLEVTDGRDILVADDVELFAEKTAQLLSDGELCRRLTAQARQLVVDRYDWDAIALSQLDLYAHVLARNPSGGDGTGDSDAHGCA